MERWRRLPKRFLDHAARRARRSALALRYRPATNLPEPLPDRVHYGCGNNILPGWLNVDGMTSSYPGGIGAASRTFRVDLRGEHPFPDQAFRFAYAEDFLEHLTQADSILFLAEALRTLEDGGVLRLSFPGLEGVLAKHYPDPSRATVQRAKVEAYEMWGHEHFYSLDSLALVAKHLGFRSLVSEAYGRSEHPELRGLETRDGQIGLNLNVELTR
jgi:predicted SAM-dependent methyltransferase